MINSFAAVIFRMKFINRWSLMNNVNKESLSQHSFECAFLSHFLALIGNIYFNKSFNADKIAAYAIFHDAAEVMTGDMPTPVKYFNDEIKNAYKSIEEAANNRLVNCLPRELGNEYMKYINSSEISSEEKKIIKIADKLCALIKCVFEMNAGNKEFVSAHRKITEELAKIQSEELKYFCENCLEAFSLSLDDLGSVL